MYGVSARRGSYPVERIGIVLLIQQIVDALFANTHGYALVLGRSVPLFCSRSCGQGDASRRWIGLKVRT